MIDEFQKRDDDARPRPFRRRNRRRANALLPHYYQPPANH